MTPHSLHRAIRRAAARGYSIAPSNRRVLRNELLAAARGALKASPVRVSLARGTK